MGTNLYAKKDPCSCCGREYEPFHVGKSSSGFHGYNEVYPIPEETGIPHRDIRTPTQMVSFLVELVELGHTLVDEYGDSFESEDVLTRITACPTQHEANCRWFLLGSNHGTLADYTWTCDGYTFSTGEFS